MEKPTAEDVKVALITGSVFTFAIFLIRLLTRKPEEG